MNRILLLLAAGLMVGAFIFGCSTEDPWNPNPSYELSLSIVSGPADTVAYGANVSFTWTSQGGIGEVEYQYRLGSGAWSEWSNITAVTFENRTTGAVFEVQARDEGNQTDSETREFYVSAAGGEDTEAPTVWIVSSPAEGSYVATGSSISFTWAGEDAVDGDNLLYWYSWNGVMSSDTTGSTTVTFANVQPANAEFMVWASDQSGNESDPVSVTFTIQDATVLYVDDFLWYDASGAIDMPKEREQKQFYRDALQGFAIAEWDVSQDGIPTNDDMSPYNVIVWCSDSDLGYNDYTWNDSALAVEMDTYLSNGGKLLVTGPWTIGDMMDYDYEVQTGSFVYDWFAVDTMHQAIDTTWWWYGVPFDTLVAFPDSVVIDTSELVSWDYWNHFTWAVAVENSLFDLPDSMKIDVAKNGDQDDYAIQTVFLRNDPANNITTEKLFLWGLDVDGDEPIAYNTPIGHVVSISGVRQVAMLNFDTFAMPLPQITQTFQSIVTEFGE